MRSIPVLFVFALFTLLSPYASSHVLIVPSDYQTITLAIEAALPGDTIMVGPGEYRERVLINKPVVLLGAKGPYHTVINSTGLSLGSQSHVIRVTASCEVIGFTLQSSDPYTFGVDVDGRYGNAEAVSLKSNIIAHFSYSGVAALDCTLSVKNSLIYANQQTAIIMQDTKAEILNNTMHDNGINCYRGCQAVVMNNIVENVYIADSSTVIRSYNNVRFNAEYENDELSVPALYVDDSLGDFHLPPSSACINKGNPDPAYNDLDSSRNDIGAFGGPDSRLLQFDRGDMNRDWQLSLTDLSQYISYYFLYGEVPGPLAVADFDCDGSVKLTDLVLLAEFLFREGLPPCDQ